MQVAENFLGELREADVLYFSFSSCKMQTIFETIFLYVLIGSLPYHILSFSSSFFFFFFNVYVNVFKRVLKFA